MNIAIILAGGKGSRMGIDLPKQFLSLCYKPVIAHSIEAFNSHPLIDGVLVVCNPDYIELMKEIVKKYNLDKVFDVIGGGKTRQESSLIGLLRVEDEFSPDDIVVIHDAARPLVSERIISDNLSLASEFGACVTAIPMQDSVLVTKNGKEVSSYADRSELMAVQTPQSFVLGKILRAYQNAPEGLNATDDSSVAFKMGIEVKIAEGEKRNIKITTGEDMELAKLWAKCSD